MALAPRSTPVDPAELVARVAASRRDLLLRVNRRRLRWEDLEDCYSQAVLELVARARRAPFESAAHAQNALEQKFASRIDDRRRAIGGRSSIECALAAAVSVDSPGSRAEELADPGAELVRQVSGRIEVRRLREVAGELSADQRLVLACQLSLGMDCAEFCERFGWSGEKFRKVAQRGRARLRVLIDEYQLGERCARLAGDLDAVSAGVASTEQIERAGTHIENCRACARTLHQLDRAARQVAAVLPAPVGIKASLAAAAWALRGLLGGRHTGARAGAGVAGAAGGGAATAKLGAVAVCVVGAAACAHSGLLGFAVPLHHSRHTRQAVRAAPPQSRALARLERRAPRPRLRTEPHAAIAALPRPVIAAKHDFGFERHSAPVRREPRAAPRASPEFSPER